MGDSGIILLNGGNADDLMRYAANQYTISGTRHRRYICCCNGKPLIALLDQVIYFTHIDILQHTTQLSVNDGFRCSASSWVVDTSSDTADSNLAAKLGYYLTGNLA